MRKLLRSRQYRMIAGICGGLGEYLNVDPTIIRVIVVVLSLLTAAFPGLLIYLVLWLIIPDERG